MPSLGADMEHGKILEWLVKPGDYVRRGDLVAVVDTDKTVMDVESFQEGVVADLLVGIGETVPVGTPLAVITQTPAEVGAPGARAAPPAGRRLKPLRLTPRPPERGRPDGGLPRSPLPCGIWRTGWALTPAGSRAPARTAPSPAADVEHAVAARTGGPGRVRSSPRARRLAAELGIGLSTVTGTGPDGAVTVADVQRAADSRAPGGRSRLHRDANPRAGTRRPPEAPQCQQRRPPSEARERVASLRRAIGALMTRSKQTIPHYYL